ncbi:MAG: hypothetical protein ACREQ9_16630, partial [Candidatus Binatia bacterium]
MPSVRVAGYASGAEAARGRSARRGGVMKASSTIVLVIALSLAAGCRGDAPPRVPTGPEADAEGHTAPTRFVAEANAAVAESLPLADRQDLEDASRGRIAG